MNKIRDIYRLKYGVVEPNIYLGANIWKVQLEYGTISWSMNSKDYETNTINNSEDIL